MSNENFFLHEDILEKFENLEHLQRSINRLVSIFRKFETEEIETTISVSAWEMKLPNGGLMYEILYNEVPPLELPRDLRRELMQYLDRCAVNNEANNITITISRSDKTVSAHTSGVYSLALAAFRKKHKLPIFADLSDNVLATSAKIEFQNLSTPCFIITSDNDLIGFYRSAIESLQLERDDFVAGVAKAFPNLVFHPDVRIEQLEVDLTQHLGTILQHLAFLNDEYPRLGKEVNWDLPSLKSSAAARDIDFSDESSNTKQDAKKIGKRVRTFTIKGTERKLTCSLHTKITRTIGRIHFYNPLPEDPNRVFIGIFDKHLPI